jgi:hypothetical protein
MSDGRKGLSGLEVKRQGTLPDASPVSGVPPPPEYRWKPGQSGNPGGRPRLLVTVTEAATRLLNGEKMPPGPRPKTWDIAAAIIKRAQAVTGKTAAYAGTATEQLLDRTEGKVPTSISSDGILIVREVAIGGRPATIQAEHVIDTPAVERHELPEPTDG